MSDKKLRKTAFEEILLDLDRSLLTRHEFETSYNKDDTILKILFKDRPEFYFIVRHGNKTNPFFAYECPGLYFTDEDRFELRDFSSCRSRISGWAQRIMEELIVGDQKPSEILEAMRNRIKENAEKLDEPDKPFGDEEAEIWIQKIEETLKQIDKLKEKLKIQERDVIKLKNDMESLKGNATMWPKKIWVKAVGNRVLSIMEGVATSAIKVLAEVTVKGFLNSGKGS